MSEKTKKQFFNTFNIFLNSNIFFQNKEYGKNFILYHNTNGKPYDLKEVEYKLKLKNDDIQVFVSDDTDIEYIFNNYQFRTDPFKNFTNDSVNILASGCSQTYGREMPNSLIWPTMLKNKIIETKNTTLYNLGMPGFETQRIISNCYIFIEKYGVPDYICLLLPPIQRSLFVDKLDRIVSEQRPISFENVESLHKLFYDKRSNFASTLINNILCIKNFELFCNINNIKLSWHSWCEVSQEVYENFNFKNIIKKELYIKELNDIPVEYEEKEINNNKYWHRAADGDHEGYKKHLIWTNMFYNIIEGDLNK